MVGTRGKKIDIHELLQSNKQRFPARAAAERSPRKDHALQSPTVQRKSSSQTSQSEERQKAAYVQSAVITPEGSNGLGAILSSTSGNKSASLQVKRGRGRPRKSVSNHLNPSSSPVDQSPAVKRKRGRPRKLLSTADGFREDNTIQDEPQSSGQFSSSLIKDQRNLQKLTSPTSGDVKKVVPVPSLDNSPHQVTSGSQSFIDGTSLEVSRGNVSQNTDSFNPCAASGVSQTAAVGCSSSDANVSCYANNSEMTTVMKRQGSPLMSGNDKKHLPNQEAIKVSSNAAAAKNDAGKHTPELKLSWSKSTRDDTTRDETSKNSASLKVGDGTMETGTENQGAGDVVIDRVTEESANDVQLVLESSCLPDTKPAEHHVEITSEVTDGNQWTVIGHSEGGTNDDGSNLNGLVDESTDQVILIVPSKISDSQVEEFIAENLVDIPNSYIIKREPPEVDDTVEDMNSLDVLVQLAVGDGKIQNFERQEPGKDAFDQMPVYFPHLSICKEPIPLKVCDREHCMCNLYHCQLCQPQHGGAFTKSIMRVHYDYHWKKGTKYGDYNINICLLDCNAKPHQHCPLCGTTVEYVNKSVSSYLSHLATCVDRERYKSQMGMKLTQYGKDSITGRGGSAVAAGCSSVLVPHPSIIHVDDQLEEMRCTPDNGCNCEYSHCPLCPIDKQQFKYQCKAAKHFQFHMKHCIIFNGYRIMICMLPCCVYSHYHCPLCGSTFQRKCDLQIHVTRRCKGPARRRKRKTGMIKQNLVEMYSSGETVAVSYLKRINEDEAAGIIAMCEANTRLIDVSQINVPHLSIIHKDTTVHPTHCVKSEHSCRCGEPYCLLCAERRLVAGCNCGQYHCIMCPQNKLTAKRIPRARDHIHSHYKRAIPFKDHLVLSCGLLECVPEKRHGYHYHCPQCGVITFLIECFRRHLYSGCQVKETYFRFVEQGKSAGVTSMTSTRPMVTTDLDHNPPLVQVKQEITTSQDKDVDGGDLEVTNGNTSVSGEADQKTGIINALPSVSADKALLAKAITPKKKTSKTQVLQCVSADLQEDVLRKASPSCPDDLLAMLRKHIGVSYEQCPDTATYRVQGSWEMLETASTVILQLIESKPNNEDDVWNVIKEHIKAVDEADDNRSQVYSEQKPASDTPPEHTQQPPATHEVPDADVTYWQEVNNLDKYFEAKKNLNIPVRCPSCRKRLASLNNLIIHWQARPGCMAAVDVDHLPKSYARVVGVMRQIDEPTCPGCGKRFLSLVSCVSHFVREVCRRNDSFRRMVEFGIGQDAMSSAYRCPKCAYTSAGRRQVVSHYEKCHMPKVYPCPYERCRAEFATREALARHVDVIHVNPTRNKVPCELCGVPLKRSSMQYHLVSKHSQLAALPRLNCPSCDYSSWSSVNLRLHVVNKHGEKRHRCRHCGKGFGAVNKLNQHVNFVHKKLRLYPSSGERTMTQCQICNAVLYKKNMTRHMQTVHLRQTEYPCHGCDKVFYNKRARWLHNLCHLTNAQNERVYLFRCPTCQKGFNRRWWYTEHLQNAHSATKPYECDVCGRAFRFKLLYNKHRASHAPVSSECSICKTVFSSVRSLRLHMAGRHAAKGVVTCSCGVQFTSLSNYRDHRLVCRHGDEDDVSGGDRKPVVPTSDNSEILVSDGIQYETRVVDLSVAADSQLDIGDPEAGAQGVAVEHLEAAQTLESIAVVPQEADADKMASDVREDDKPMISYIQHGGISAPGDPDCGGIALVLSASSEQCDGGGGGDVPDDGSRMVVLETGDNGEVFLRTADGQQLSEEEGRRILLEMDQSQTDSELLAMDEDNGRASDEPTGGYMCGFCSVIYQSLDDMDSHIKLSHADQLTSAS